MSDLRERVVIPPSHHERPDFSHVSEGRRANMQAIKGKNTGPELVVRTLLHRLGYRYRLHARELPGRPDIVFSRRKKAIEVRGCFWHHHDEAECPNAVLPKTRAEWWRSKLEANVARDRRNASALRSLGWDVEVVWECQVGRSDLNDRLELFLGPPGGSPPARSNQSGELDE